MSQKRVDFLSTQMSVDFLSTLDHLAETRGGRFVHKVPNQGHDTDEKEIGSRDTCYFENSDSQLSYIYTAYTSLACVATILHFQTLATCQATTWLVGTKTGCWSSFVSFVANFSSVQFCHPCHLSYYSRWLFPLIWT